MSNKLLIKEKYEEVLAYLNSYFHNNNSIIHSERLAQLIIEFLVNYKLGEGRFEVETFEDKRTAGVLISYGLWDKDKNIELRRYKSNTYEVVINFGVEEDPLVYRHKLSKEQIFLIPAYLQECMLKTIEAGKPSTFEGKIIID